MNENIKTVEEIKNILSKTKISNIIESNHKKSIDEMENDFENTIISEMYSSTNKVFSVTLTSDNDMFNIDNIELINDFIIGLLNNYLSEDEYDIEYKFRTYGSFHPMEYLKDVDERGLCGVFISFNIK